MYLVTIQKEHRVRVVERTNDLEVAEALKTSLNRFDPSYNSQVVAFVPQQQQPRRQWNRDDCQRLIFLAEAMKQNLLPNQKSPDCFLLLDGKDGEAISVAGRLVWHGKNWFLVPEDGKERLCGRIVQAVKRREKKHG